MISRSTPLEKAWQRWPGRRWSRGRRIGLTLSVAFEMAVAIGSSGGGGMAGPTPAAAVRAEVRKIRKGAVVETQGVVLARSGVPVTAHLVVTATSLRLKAGVVSRRILNDVPLADLYPLTVGGDEPVRAAGVDITKGHGCVQFAASPWEWIYLDDEKIAVVACLARWPHPDTLAARPAGVEA